MLGQAALVVSLDIHAAEPAEQVENALRLGADSVKVLASSGDRAQWTALERYALACERWGMPFQAEVIPGGFDQPDKHTPNNIALVCRQAAEMGADYVKTLYTGDPESMQRVVEGATVPVVILGGDRATTKTACCLRWPRRWAPGWPAWRSAAISGAMPTRPRSPRDWSRSSIHDDRSGRAPITGGRSTYRRSVITGPHQVEFEDVAIPEPGPRQVLVRVAAAALCTWEQRVYAGIDTGSYPLIGGHEFSGEVVAIGPGVAQKLGAGRPGGGGRAAAVRRMLGVPPRLRQHLRQPVRARTRGPGKPWGPSGFGQYALVDGYQIYRFPRRGQPAGGGAGRASWRACCTTSSAFRRGGGTRR